jgi:hypothetical protein
MKVLFDIFRQIKNQNSIPLSNLSCASLLSTPARISSFLLLVKPESCLKSYNGICKYDPQKPGNQLLLFNH